MHCVAGDAVEILVAIVVEEQRALGARPRAVEPSQAEHARECRVSVCSVVRADITPRFGEQSGEVMQLSGHPLNIAKCA